MPQEGTCATQEHAMLMFMKKALMPQEWSCVHVCKCMLFFLKPQHSHITSSAAMEQHCDIKQERDKDEEDDKEEDDKENELLKKVGIS